MILGKSILITFLASVCIITSDASTVWILRDNGIGPVKIGMSLSQLNAVLHENFSLPEAKDDQGCFYVDPSNHTQVLFMIEDGHLVRIEVNARGVPTEKGIQVGDSEKRTLQVYGPGLKVEPNAYSPEDHYLTVHSGSYGIRFETDKGRIETFYAGRFDAIQYIEGCE
jgi:hypothetical protein